MEVDECESRRLLSAVGLSAHMAEGWDTPAKITNVYTITSYPVFYLDISRIMMVMNHVWQKFSISYQSPNTTFKLAQYKYKKLQD